MRIRSLFWGVAMFLAVFLVGAGSASAAGESVTAIALSSNKVTPGFELEFTIHSQANVRQNVNTHEAVAIPDGWFVEISQNPQYPNGVWGIYRVLLPENNITTHDGNIFSFEAPPEAGYYRIRMQDPEGNFHGSEVFRVTSEAFVAMTPSRAFEQGSDVVFRIYDADGNPWNINNWGNAQDLYNVDVYYFGAGGPVSYAAPVGNTPARVSRIGDGTYSFGAGNRIAEYYLNFNRYPFIAMHSSSFNVVAGDGVAEPEEEVEETPEEELPPVQDPFQDDSETDPEDAEPSTEPVVEEVEEESVEEVEQEVEETQQEVSETSQPVVESESEHDLSVMCSLQIGKAYKARNSSAVYMVVRPHHADGRINTESNSCTKRAFTKSQIFFTYFDSWSEVIVDDAILTIPNDGIRFLPLGKKYDPKYGALVKVVSDPKVYLLLGGERYWINSESVFTSLGYSWNWIEDISEELLYSYAEGSEIVDISRHPNFTLIKYEGDSRVYRLEADPNDSTRTLKRHILNEAAFNALGYRWDRVVTVPASETYPDGEPLSASSQILLKAR